MSGKGAFTPNLPLLQRLLVFRLLPPGQMPLDGSLEITVHQLPGALPVRFAQALLPHRTAGTILSVRPILPEQPAGTAVQPLGPKPFSVGAEIGVFPLAIRKGLPLELRLGMVMIGLRPDKEIDTMLLQHTMGQWKVVGRVRSRGLKGNHIFVDLFQMLQIGNYIDVLTVNTSGIILYAFVGIHEAYNYSIDGRFL